MRPSLLLVGFLLAVALTGCVGEKTVKPPIPDQGVSSTESAKSPDSSTAETSADSDDPVLSSLESDLQDLETLLMDLESEETLDISELLDLQ